MRQIAFYGKGGIGKSTTTSNVSASLAAHGHAVMQIGCDPKADSTTTLTNGERIPNILDIIRTNEFTKQIKPGNGSSIHLDDIVKRGFNGVLCSEAGGPEPGVGCAGRGIITAMEMLKDFNAFEVHKPEYILYDVLGDVVCGGFAMPIRQGLADEVFVITSGELMALYACNNIFKGIQKFAKNSNTRVGGIIVNSRNTENEIEIVMNFAEATKTNVIHVVPRDSIVQKSEMQGKTTLEYDAESNQARSYLDLSKKIINIDNKHVPQALDNVEFSDWCKRHSELFQTC